MKRLHIDSYKFPAMDSNHIVHVRGDGVSLPRGLVVFNCTEELFYYPPCETSLSLWLSSIFNMVERGRFLRKFPFMYTLPNRYNFVFDQIQKASTKTSANVRTPVRYSPMWRTWAMPLSLLSVWITFFKVRTMFQSYLCVELAHNFSSQWKTSWINAYWPFF